MSNSVTLVKALRIYDAQNSFATNVKISVGIQHNRPTSSQTTYNSKYPYHIHTGKPSYYSGSCTITYSNDDEDEEEIDDCDQYVEEYIEALENGTMRADELVKYSNLGFEISEWLHNDLTKYLVIAENITIPIGILGEVKFDISTTQKLDELPECSFSFDWEQVADIIKGGGS